MNCKQFRSYIPKFFANELNTCDTEEFLLHVSSCKECAEELEIMHLMSVGLSQLEGDGKEETYDFRGLLADKIAMAQKQCKRVHRAEHMHNMFVVLVNLMAVIGIVYQIFMLFGGETWLANYF